MKLTLDISDDHIDEFIELIKDLAYVSVEEPGKGIPIWQQEEVAERLELLRQGKIKTREWEKARKDIFGK